MRFKTTILLFASIFFACEEEVSPPDFAEEDKLVVNAIISPFLPEIIVDVSLSRNAFGLIDRSLDDEVVLNATVILRSETQEIVIPFDLERFIYVISSEEFPLVSGEKYRLEVEGAGFSVFGETVLPKQLTSLTSIRINENNVLSLSWQDFPELGNHYRISAEGFISEFNFAESFSFNSDEFISDLNRNGDVLTARGEGNEFSNGYDQITVRVITSDALYSDYFRVLTNYVEDDPFSDPVQLPSNIEGGIGIFAAVQVSQFTIEAQ